MSNAATTAEASAADPLKTAADAMATAVQAAKDGALDAQSRVSELMPAISGFVSRFTYTTCYALSYGVVFPTLLVVRAVPKENALVHGLIDGGRAARGVVASMRPDSAGVEHELEEEPARSESAAGGVSEESSGAPPSEAAAP